MSVTERLEKQGQQFQLEGSGPEAYQRYLVPIMFAPWARHLVDLVAPRTGERVLDVACGTGVVARGAATKVGDEGTVVGLDVNDGMLQVARAHLVGYPPGDRMADGQRHRHALAGRVVRRHLLPAGPAVLRRPVGRAARDAPRSRSRGDDSASPCGGRSSSAPDSSR